MHKRMDSLYDLNAHLITNDPNNPDLVMNVLSNCIP
jgi:hypothetical protein